MTNNQKDIIKRLDEIESRVSFIEKELNITNKIEHKEIEENHHKGRFSQKTEEKPRIEEEISYDDEFIGNEKSSPNFTFNQILSFLGIGGIVIGLLSLFFYAISNN